MLKKTLVPDEGPDPDALLETIGTYQTVFEADLIREELASAGIEAWTGGATIAQTFVTMPETGITIDVRADDAEKARAVIASIGTVSPVTDDEMNAAIDASIADANPGV
jgi:hypothetical protein